jgi:hypothetical protein
VVAALEVAEVEAQPPAEVEVLLDLVVELFLRAAGREAGQLLQVRERGRGPGRLRDRSRSGEEGRQARGAGEERRRGARGNGSRKVDRREDLADRLERYRIGPRERLGGLADGVEQLMGEVALRAGVEVSRDGGAARGTEQRPRRAQRPPPPRMRARRRAGDGVAR